MTEVLRPSVVVMGVSGSGKSTIGALVAELLHVQFMDGDDLHPLANVRKMAAGAPLNDSDRWPWLAKVGVALAERKTTGVVVACSALRKSYRDVIRQHAPASQFVLLTGSRHLLESRMAARRDHFMPASLLDTQLESLEPLGEDEAGFAVDISELSQVVAETVVRRLH